MVCVCNGVMGGHVGDLLAPHSATQRAVHRPAASAGPGACSVLQNLRLNPPESESAL